MRGFVLDQYELNPTKFDRFRDFCLIYFKISKQNGPTITHFPTFSQSPSPQAPWHPSQKMRLEISCNLGPVSSRLDQMAPHSCPFFVSNFDMFSTTPTKTRLGTLGITGRRKGNLLFFIFYLFLLNDSTIPQFPFLRPVI